MPALSRVKSQAKKIACQAKLKQWGLIFKLYTDDYDGYFNNRDINNAVQVVRLGSDCNVQSFIRRDGFGQNRCSQLPFVPRIIDAGDD